MTEQTASYRLVLSRILTAPRPQVYRAFAEPAQLIQWLGPQGWSVREEDAEFDIHPGGRQRFAVIRSRDPRQRIPVDLMLDEVVDGELLIGHQEPRDATGAELRLEFHDVLGGKTRLELRQGPYTREQEIDAEACWNSCLGCLDVVLER